MTLFLTMWKRHYLRTIFQMHSTAFTLAYTTKNLYSSSLVFASENPIFLLRFRYLKLFFNAIMQGAFQGNGANYEKRR